MRKKLLVVGTVILSSIFVISMLNSHAQDISLSDWESNFPGYVKGAELQNESGKPLALFFYTDWCASCKDLRKDVLSTPEVKAFMQNLHPVKINPETSSYEETLAQEYGVIGYPSFFIVLKNGDVIKRIRRTSNVSPEQFVQQLQAAIDS